MNDLRNQGQKPKFSQKLPRHGIFSEIEKVF